MASGTPFRLSGPAFISNSAADVYNDSDTAVFTSVTQIHIANIDNAPQSFSLYLGASGGSTAGTQLEGDYPVAANRDWDRFFSPALVMKSTDFLTAISSAANTLVITVMGTKTVVP